MERRGSESAQDAAKIPHGEFRCAINNELEEARVRFIESERLTCTIKHRQQELVCFR